MSRPTRPAVAQDEEISERRRYLLLAGLVVVAALAAIGDTALPHSASQVAVAPSPPTVAVGPAASTAWYCPGPLPVGPRAEAASIAVANLGGTRLAGQLRVARTSGASSAEAVSVAPDGERILALPQTGTAGWAAVTVLLDGAGAAVEQVVRGAFGTAASPCVEAAAQTTYFPSGSTVGAADLSLALYDPTGTPAVVEVSVATGSGTVSPPALQGVSVGAGELVVVDLGRDVPEQKTVATTVTTTSGQVATGALVTVARPGGGLTEAITTGTSETGSRWWFAPAPLGPRASETFAVLDPGSSASRVALRLGSGSSASELVAVVPAGQVVQIAAPAPATAVLSWASVVTRGGPPVVVARQTVVRPAAAVPASGASRAGDPTGGKPAKPAGGQRATKAAGPAPNPSRGHLPSSKAPVGRTPSTTAGGTPRGPAASSTRATATAPRAPAGVVAGVPPLAPGTSITLGTPRGAAEWVLPGGEVDSAVSELLVLANPGRRPVVVLIERLVPGSGELAPLSGRLLLPAGGELAWTPNLVAGADSGGLALVVRASRSVVAASFLFGRNPARGLASPAGLPVSG